MKEYDLGEVRSVRYLAEGLMNRNWRVSSQRGDFAVKQIVDVSLPLARRNLAVVAALAADGVPAAVATPSAAGELVVEIEERGYALFPWIPGDHIPGVDLAEPQAYELGTVLGGIHLGLNQARQNLLPDKPTSLRASVPTPEAALGEADRFAGLALADAQAGSDFGRQVVTFLGQRRVLLDKYAALRPTSDEPRGAFGWRHGDFHHLNVKWLDGRVQGVLDWDRIRVGNFGEEVVRSSTLIFGRESGDLDLVGVRAFVNGYRSITPLGNEDLADALQRLWWKRMCDYWQLEFHYDRGDRSCDHLFISASLFLDWWTNHLDEVQFAFTA